MSDNAKQRMVVIGGGFAGLNLIKHLDRDKWDVTIVDRNNFHSFPPLFYQLASAGLDAGSIIFPLRREMRSRHARGCRFHMGDVTEIDTDARTVTTQFETIPYDKLVIAAGTTNNFFGIPDLEKYVYPLKSTSEAIRCRNDILDRLERAAIEPDPARRRHLLSFAIIGGGPTGVEIAGALGEMKRYILKREYPSINPDDVTVTLVEGAPRLLQAMSEKSSARVLKDLNSLLVNVKLGAIMKSYENNVITFADGSTLDSSMVIWTAGITGVSFNFKGSAQPEIGPGRRFVVDEYNRVNGLDDVFAVGDISIHCSEDTPRGLPQVAQVAIQGGRNLARNLNAGVMKYPFVYRDKGSMATVGRNRAVVDLKHIHMSGWIAWVAWMLVHLMSLLGMRNKLTVLITWAWAYFTYSSSVRFMIHVTRYPLRHRWGELDNSPKPQ